MRAFDKRQAIQLGWRESENEWFGGLESVRQIGGIRSHYTKKMLMRLAHVPWVKNYVSSRQLERLAPVLSCVVEDIESKPGSVFVQTKHLGQVYKSSYL